MVDGMLDIVAVVLILGIVFSVGFGVVIPLMDIEFMGYNDKIEDKSTTGVVKGYDLNTLLEAEKINNPTGYKNSDIYKMIPKKKELTAPEVILTTQIQDFGMSSPKKIKIGALTEEVVSTYKLTIRNQGLNIWNNIADKTLKYTIEYSYGSHLIVGDEVYEIKVIP